MRFFSPYFCDIVSERLLKSFLEFMDALTAPRAFRKTESMSQNKMRGLGIEESDSKNNVDAVAPHHHEAAKPRGIGCKMRKLPVTR